MAPQAHPRLPVRSVRLRSLRTTLFLEVFALLVLMVCAVTATAFLLARSELKSRVTSQLQSVVQAKETLLESTISRQREQLSALGRDPSLQSLQSLTTLVGFRQLLKVTADGTQSTLAGSGNLSVTAFARTEHTLFRPILTEDGWVSYVIAAPQVSNGKRTGTLVAVFDVRGLAVGLLQADYIGATAEILLATTKDEGGVLLRTDEVTGQIIPVRGPGAIAFYSFFDSREQAEGIAETKDYSGIPGLVAYRTAPSIGWMIIVKVDRYEVTEPVLRIALNLSGASLMVVVFLSLSMFFLARRIIGPLETLTQKLDGIETKQWMFRRSIFTGNELETVDAAADDLTSRLRQAHDHLEAAVQERTRELKAQTATDAAILQSMDDGLVVTDAAGKVTYMNRTAEVFIGIEKAMSKPVTDLVRIIDADGREIDERSHPVMCVLRTGKRVQSVIDPHFALLKPDGTEVALQIRTTPILRGSTCLGAVAMLRDVSEERRIDHMKSEFISLVSHQLRTPLSSMRWYLEMLIGGDMGKLNTEQSDLVAQVSTSNARMVRLVNALLNVSRIELGKFQLSPEVIDAQELLRAASASSDVELKQKKLQLQFNAAADKIGIRTDRGLLVLVLENLVSNAIKYSPEGATIVLSAILDDTKKAVIFSVTDTGIGIPAGEQKDIGLKLFRAANAKTSDTDGNGLGLYISKLATETIGGSLTFKSIEGKGSTFSITLPLNPGEKTA